MGMRVELGAFLQPGVLGLAALLTVVAIVGKQVCALGGIGAPVDRTAIGIGMIPRGEVGLIFANIGLGLTVRGERIVDERIFAAVVVAVMMTTLVTPPALKWRLSERCPARRRRRGDPDPAASVSPDAMKGVPRGTPFIVLPACCPQQAALHASRPRALRVPRCPGSS